MAECVFKWVKHGELMIGVNTAGRIDDETWSRFIEDLADEDCRYYIGCTLGILEVTSRQRKQAATLLREQEKGLVVITDEVLVRGIVTAVSWLGAKVRSFAWKDFDRGLEQLGLNERKDAVLELVDGLRAECEAVAEERRKRQRELRRNA